MAEFNIKIHGIEGLERALARNSEVVLRESKKFIQRALAKYRSGVINNPWRIGMSGGGSPVLTGNLRDTHLVEATAVMGRIAPNTAFAPYANAVHRKRPWLDFVFKDKKSEVEELEKEFLEAIIGELAK